jgi:peptide deformylase
MTLQIAQLGQPVLRRRADEVMLEDLANPNFQRFVQDMLLTLAETGGVGLAAPQVFVSWRLFLARVGPASETEGPTVEVFLNPRLLDASSEVETAWEGCLSFPELLVQVARPQRVRLTYKNLDGEDQVLDLEGFPARVVQHELDHLDGILTLDRAASPRDIIKASEIDAVLRDRAEKAGISS